MASQHRKHRGNRTVKVVADFLTEWWPHALPTGAGRSGKDVTGVPFDIEVKARTAFSPKEWLSQVIKRNKSGGLPFVVVRMNGQGEDAEKYLAFMQFGDLVQLLIQAGYGEFQGNVGELVPERCNKCGAWTFKDVSCKTCSRAANANL